MSSNMSVGVTIQMAQTQQEVTEGGMVTVCASLTDDSAVLGRDVTIMLATSFSGSGERV